ncbi:MAG: hypothetical protein EBY39_10715, partial [Flavobacteriia bacterium]|nr:hypothetical protein [Flavobacteriia bacterium]
MAEQSQRLSKVAKEFNVGVDTILEFLASKGVDDLNRNSKISTETYEVLVDEYQPDKKVKAEAKELKKAEAEQKSQDKEEVQTLRVSVPKMEGLKIVSKVDVAESKSNSKKEEVKTEVAEPSTQKPEVPVDEKPFDSKGSDEKVVEKTDEQSKKPEESSQDNIFMPALEEKTTEGASVIRAKAKKLDGPTIVSSEKIDLSKFKKPEKKPVASSSAKIEGKKKRKRVSTKPNT